MSDNGAISKKYLCNVSKNEDICVICCKFIQIYSIGECNHPICYECSTRMRVLCKRTECPICRQRLSKVTFCYKKVPYCELYTVSGSKYYYKKYKISFYNAKIRREFFQLFNNSCPECKCPPFDTFDDLRQHVSKYHDLHYCSLCTQTLKVFTYERKCYTRKALGSHFIKGDADDSSHRGHPLCKLCNVFFFDTDELLFHLKYGHYSCHLCNDGLNSSFNDFPLLMDHFMKNHVVCRLGNCRRDILSSVFATEADYEDHLAEVHNIPKQQTYSNMPTQDYNNNAMTSTVNSVSLQSSYNPQLNPYNISYGRNNIPNVSPVCQSMSYVPQTSINSVMQNIMYYAFQYYLKCLQMCSILRELENVLQFTRNTVAVPSIQATPMPSTQITETNDTNGAGNNSDDTYLKSDLTGPSILNEIQNNDASTISQKKEQINENVKDQMTQTPISVKPTATTVIAELAGNNDSNQEDSLWINIPASSTIKLSEMPQTSHQ